MAHYSQPGYSAADAYSPRLSSSTAPILSDKRLSSQYQTSGAARHHEDQDDENDSSDGESNIAEGVQLDLINNAGGDDQTGTYTTTSTISGRYHPQV